MGFQPLKIKFQKVKIHFRTPKMPPNTSKRPPGLETFGKYGALCIGDPYIGSILFSIHTFLYRDTLLWGVPYIRVLPRSGSLT